MRFKSGDTRTIEVQKEDHGYYIRERYTDKPQVQVRRKWLEDCVYLSDREFDKIARHLGYVKSGEIPNSGFKETL